MASTSRILGATLVQGLLLVVVWLVFLFLGSMALGDTAPTLSTAANAVIAGLMFITAWGLARRNDLDSRAAAIGLGAVWVVIFAAVQLGIAIPNGTVGVIFGSWSAYLVHAGIFLGAALQPRSHR